MNKRIIIILALLGIIFSLAASRELILDVQVTGNINIESPLIVAATGIEKGAYLSEERIASAIRNLHQLSIFDNILIKKEEITGGLRIIIEVTEYPIVSDIDFTGNKKIKDGKITEFFSIKKGSYLSPVSLIENKKLIRQEYTKIGYNFASVEYEAKDLPNNYVSLRVIIDEGEKIAVRSINFYGNRNLSNRQLARKMKTKQSSLFRSGKFEQEKFDEDLESIINFYTENGFLDANIDSSEKIVSGSRYLIINIHITEGTKYHFGEVSISGNKRFTDEVLLNNLRFQDDEVFNLEKFNKQVAQLASMYYEEGYIYAAFDQDLQRVGNKVNINLTVSENNRAKVRKIFIDGNRKTKEKVIRRQLAISPGEYFRQSNIIRTQQNIYNLGFFEPNINLDYRPINEDGDIDLLIEVEDKHSGSANAGVGYNSQDKFIGQLSVSHNNLLGKAWQGGLKWEFGGSTQNFELDFTNPYFYDSFNLVGFNAYHTRRDWSSFNYKVMATGGSVRVGRSLFVLDYSRLVASYSFYRKKYEIINPEGSGLSDYLKELDSLGWRDTSSLSLTFSRDSRDNIYHPTSGTHFIVFSELAGGPLQGNFNYFKQILQTTWHTRTFWKLILRSKWRFGYITAFGDSDEVPPDERFYLGGTGADGLRGYAERSIPTKTDEGGLRAIIHSTELTVPIAGDQIIGLLFFDAGNSFNKLEEFNFPDFKKGTGAGIRVHTPLGLIGFDYGLNLETKKWEPHFQFGTTF